MPARAALARALGAAAGLAALGLAPAALGQDAPPGQANYTKYCAQCHGETGDGLGPAAAYLKPAPRDFTAGKYKIRTTPTGSLPTDADLERVIRVGLPYTAMPGFDFLGDREIDDLVAYVKSFASDFEDPDALLPPIEIPAPPAYTAESAERGKAVYQETGCARCHGEEGRGDGRSAPTLVDDWGQHTKVADLTQAWTFRGGGTREDVFRTMATGFMGTPMPGFHGALPVEDIWAITDYIVSLSERRTEAPYAKVLRAIGRSEAIDLEKGVELFADAPEAMFPVLGQIVEPGRSFFRPVTAVRARAIYDEQDIAILLQWNDMRAETSGTNGPDLLAPEWLEEIAAMPLLFPEGVGAAGGSGATGDDVWGDAAADDGGVWGDAEADDSGGDVWGDAALAEDEAGGDDVWGDALAADDGGGADDVWGDAVADDGAADDFWGTGDASAAAAPSGPDTEFSDAVGIQFPLALPEGIQKPYFLLGDGQNPVELWFADLATREGQSWIGRGSRALAPSEGSPPEVVASFEDGQWSVIFKRRRRAGGAMTFSEETFHPVAFSVWDGFHRERGNRRGVTRWYDLYLEPMDTPSPWPRMARTFVGVLLAELFIIFLVRRRHRRAGEAAPAPSA